jgi:hypothetical protein
MERHEIALERAQKDIHLADHMLSVTYKLVKEPKMLLTVMERLHSSLISAIASILYYERYYKRIPPFPENQQAMIDTFKARCARRYRFSPDYAALVSEVADILHEHRESPVEFRKDDKFVICSPNYHLKIVKVEDIKKYIEKAKSFVKTAEEMVKVHERPIAER